MSTNKSLLIRPLEPKDAVVISEFLKSQSPEYMDFFYAIDSNESTVKEVLKSVVKDVYLGLFWQGKLVVLFMLRGWDAGYEVPSYGLVCDEKYRGKDLFGLTLDFAKAICRLSGVNRLMVKVHPDNLALKNIRRKGFYDTGVEESTGNIIFHMDF